MLLQASVNSNCSYSLEKPTLGENQQFLVAHELKIITGIQMVKHNFPIIWVYVTRIHFIARVTACISVELVNTIPYPESKVHGANMGPTWVLLTPDWPHVGSMNLAIRVSLNMKNPTHMQYTDFPHRLCHDHNKLRNPWHSANKSLLTPNMLRQHKHIKYAWCCVCDTHRAITGMAKRHQTATLIDFPNS